MRYLKSYNQHSEYTLNETPDVSYFKTEKDVFYTRRRYDDEYLTFIAKESGTFTLTIGSFVTTGDVVSVSYSLDSGETWVTTNNEVGTVTITTPTVNAGDRVMWKGDATRMSNSTSTSNISRFSSTCNFVLRGNIMSLLHGDDFVGEVSLSGTTYTFNNLFNNCTKLLSAKNLSLPATTLAIYCYFSMFYNCSSLTVAPELPATTLSSNCYGQMFYNCTSLTVAPELPATTLANHCYSNIFQGCTSLTVAPELPAKTLVGNCYNSMFSNCTSLTTAPELPAITLASYCYSNMFQGCTSFTVAPELPAKTLAPDCYYYMFSGCTSLTVAPELPAKTLTEACYGGMFCNCSSLTVAPELPATTLASFCYGNMFNNCTSLTVAPKLPATSLVYSCYQDMFNGCTSLTTAPELPAVTLTGSCYNYMFSGCKNLQKCYMHAGLSDGSNCTYFMFNGCKKLRDVKFVYYHVDTNKFYYLGQFGEEATNKKLTINDCSALEDCDFINQFVGWDAYCQGEYIGEIVGCGGGGYGYY